MEPHIEDGICPKKRRLAEELAESARLYYDAVASLAQREAVEEQDPHATARDAHERANRARVAFEEHIDSHKC
jgi:hypothetical protein